MKKGKVYLIGAGPGRPDLITVRGRKILEAADVVIYDYLLDPRFLRFIKEGAKCISCSDAGKKHSNPHERKKAQDRINRLMIENCKKEKNVARLKNGDASIFSRLTEELEALKKNHIEFEIVPGVTAASAAAAFSGTPLTDREISSSVVFVTGHESIGKKNRSIDWKGISTQGTIVLYMAVCVIDRVVKLLLEAGKPGTTPAIAVSHAGDFTQRTIKTTLEKLPQKIKEQGATAPAIFIIGKTVNGNKSYDWLSKNKRILFTGLSDERFFLKDTYFHLPLIDIVPLKGYGAFDNNLRKIKSFEWIVFASRFGVEYFIKRLKAIGYDSRLLSGIKIAAVGNSTAKKLLDFGIRADLVPKNESSKGLLERFRKEDLKGRKMFMPRSDLSDKGLENGLKRLGAVVTSSHAYRNIMSEDLPDLELSNFDEIMFTSPSTVRNFKKRYGKVPKGIKISCIGDVTLAEAKKCRLLD